jgi:carbonic anhydrase
MQIIRTVFLLPLVAPLVLANPTRVGSSPRDLFVDHVHDHAPRAKATTGLQVLADGNKRFVKKINKQHPGLFEDQVKNGQHPEFLSISCSDSRTSEGNIFDALPGTLFGERSIANRYDPHDPSTRSILGFSVTEIGVQHVIVTGHYGCGGIATAIASQPNPPLDASSTAVYAWIEPLRQLYLTSNRSEIVKLREANSKLSPVPKPGIDDPGFRAVIEENIKVSVKNVANDPIIVENWKKYADYQAASKNNTATGTAPKPLFIHGWVYDIATGGLTDLKVSQGPPGVPIPTVNF